MLDKLYKNYQKVEEELFDIENYFKSGESYLVTQVRIKSLQNFLYHIDLNLSKKTLLDKEDINGCWFSFLDITQLTLKLNILAVQTSQKIIDNL